MSEITVLLFGAESSGKSSLFKRFLFPDTNPKVDSTVGAEYGFINCPEAGFKLEFWDTAGAERFQSLVPIYMKETEIGIYCVDLTKPFDKNKIDKDIARFKENAVEGAALILVGTKNDSENINAETVSAFYQLEKDILPTHTARLSSTNQKEPAELLSQIRYIGEQFASKVSSSNSDSSPQYINAIDAAINNSPSDSIMFNALVNLKKKMRTLSADKYCSIDAEVKTLMKGLDQEKDPTKLTEVIENFEENCKKHLADSHPRLKAVLKAIAAVAIAVIVTIVAALTGFGIGFAVGAWTGPAAFISGVTGASAAVGLAAGILAAVGLFKTPPVEKAVHEVAQAAKVSDLTL